MHKVLSNRQLLQPLKGQAFGLAVKIPTSHVGVTGFYTWLQFLTLVFLLVKTLGSSSDDSSNWALPLVQEAWIEFPAPDFGLGPAPVFVCLWRAPKTWELALSLWLALSLPLKQINFKQTNKHANAWKKHCAVCAKLYLLILGVSKSARREENLLKPGQSACQTLES